MSILDRTRFIVGFFACGILWATPFGATIAILLPQRFLVDSMGNATALVAQLNSFGAVVSLVANIFWGTISDRTRSRFGRRTPYIVIGSVFGGLFLYLTSVAPNPALIILSWCCAQWFLNALLAPFLAVLSDRVPDNNRAIMSSGYGLGNVLGQSLGQIVGAQLLGNLHFGILLSGITLGVCGLIVVLIWPKEPSARDLPKPEQGLASVVRAFTPPTKNCRDFYLALFGRLMMISSMYMVVNYQLYILRQYMGLNQAQAATALSITASVIMVSSLIGSVIAGPVSDKLNRRKPLVIGSALLVAVGFMIPALIPTTFSMYLWAVLYGFGNGVYGACDQALNVDVLPNKAEAGKDLGILNLSNSVGQVIGPVLTSFVVMAFGSYRLAFIFGSIALVISCFIIASIRKAK